MREDGVVRTRPGFPWTAPRGPPRSAPPRFRCHEDRKLTERSARGVTAIGRRRRPRKREVTGRHTDSIRAIELMAESGYADQHGNAWMAPASRFQRYPRKFGQRDPRGRQRVSPAPLKPGVALIKIGAKLGHLWMIRRTGV